MICSITWLLSPLEKPALDVPLTTDAEEATSQTPLDVKPEEVQTEEVKPDAPAVPDPTPDPGTFQTPPEATSNTVEEEAVPESEGTPDRKEDPAEDNNTMPDPRSDLKPIPLPGLARIPPPSIIESDESSSPTPAISEGNAEVLNERSRICHSTPSTVTAEELTQHKNYVKVIKRQEREMKEAEKKYQKKTEDLIQKYSDSFKSMKKKSSLKKKEWELFYFFSFLYLSSLTFLN